MIMYDGNGPGSVLQQPIVHNMQKKHFISTATVKWQTKLVLLWIVNLAASTVLPSAVYITMHMTGYNTVQIDLILMQTDVLFVFQWKRSKLNYIATEKKAEEQMIVVFISPSGISQDFFQIFVAWKDWFCCGLSQNVRWYLRHFLLFCSENIPWTTFF